MDLKSDDFAWSQTTMVVLGRKLTGLRGFEIGKTVEKEYVYASGDEPVDIAPGNKGYPGNLKVLKHEVDKLNDAAQLAGYADITEVPHTLITITMEYKKLTSSTRRIVTCVGVAFQELKIAMEQNAKMSEVTLPFLAMRVLHTKV
jgi:hypothetical protein